MTPIEYLVIIVLGVLAFIFLITLVIMIFVVSLMIEWFKGKP